MREQMPKEQQEYIERIEKHVLEATNMTKDEAYNFAFRCWQLGYDRSPRLKDRINMEFLQKEDIFTEFKNSMYIADMSITAMVEELVVKEICKSLPTTTIANLLNSKYGNPTNYAFDPEHPKYIDLDKQMDSQLPTSDYTFAVPYPDSLGYYVGTVTEKEIVNAIRFPMKESNFGNYIISSTINVNEETFLRMKREFEAKGLV